MVEAMARVGAACAPSGLALTFVEIQGAKFYRALLPGDEMTLHAMLDTHDSDACVRVTGSSKNERICAATITARLVPNEGRTR